MGYNCSILFLLWSIYDFPTKCLGLDWSKPLKVHFRVHSSMSSGQKFHFLWITLGGLYQELMSCSAEERHWINLKHSGNWHILSWIMWYWRYLVLPWLACCLFKLHFLGKAAVRPLPTVLHTVYLRKVSCSISIDEQRVKRVGWSQMADAIDKLVTTECHSLCGD